MKFSVVSPRQIEARCWITEGALIFQGDALAAVRSALTKSEAEYEAAKSTRVTRIRGRQTIDFFGD